MGKKRKKRKLLPRREVRDFYHSWEWKRLRYEVLRYYGSTCMCCGAKPEDGKCVVVDHVRPVRRYPKLALDFHNCQVLCNDCNMGKGSHDETDWRPEQLEPEAQAHMRSIIVEERKH